LSPDQPPDQRGSLALTSRRGFLTGAAPLAVGGPALAQAGRSRAGAAAGSLLAYAGTYSSSGPEGTRANGPGILTFEKNPSTGVLSQRDVLPFALNPSWLAFNPARTHLYSANETLTFEGANSGSVSAFSIQRSTGRLTLLNTVSSQGAGPAHVSVHPSGRYLLAANYNGGTIAVFPIQPDGALGAAVDVHHDQGRLGPNHASSAPPGAFAKGHESPHAHMIQADPSGRFVFSNDLALDRILVWEFDVETGKLSANDPAGVDLPPGDGPRHFAFHPNRRWFYSLQEEGSTLALFDYDAGRGQLTARRTVSTLPKGFAGTSFTSEVVVSPGGRFLYAANRLHDSIALFSIGEDGALAYAGEEWTRGSYPRSFTIDPTGDFLYVCNQRSDAIVTFRADRKTGKLAFTGQYTPVGSPSILVFLT